MKYENLVLIKQVDKGRMYLLVYKSTFYDLNSAQKNGPRLIHKSYAKKKIGFEALKVGIDLYTSKYGITSLALHHSL